MTVEDFSIIAGLGTLAYLFSHFAFQFLRSQQEGESGSDIDGNVFNWNRNLGVLCFLLSIIFVNMLMYTMVLIAQNTSVVYLNDTILVIGMEAVMWSTLGGIGLYLFALVLYSGRFIHETVMVWFKGRRKGSVD